MIGFIYQQQRHFILFINYAGPYQLRTPITQTGAAQMRAIVIKQYGGPEVLQIEERPDPQPKPGHVIIDVKAFGLNHAEIYFRKGLWGDVAEITGIDCVGRVRSDADGRFTPGQTVMALVGGLGRSINGSYAEQVCV